LTFIKIHFCTKKNDEISWRVGLKTNGNFFSRVPHELTWVRAVVCYTICGEGRRRDCRMFATIRLLHGVQTQVILPATSFPLCGCLAAPAPCARASLWRVIRFWDFFDEQSGASCRSSSWHRASPRRRTTPLDTTRPATSQVTAWSTIQRDWSSNTANNKQGCLSDRWKKRATVPDQLTQDCLCRLVLEVDGILIVFFLDNSLVVITIIHWLQLHLLYKVLSCVWHLHTPKMYLKPIAQNYGRKFNWRAMRHSDGETHGGTEKDGGGWGEELWDVDGAEVDSEGNHGIIGWAADQQKQAVQIYLLREMA